MSSIDKTRICTRTSVQHSSKKSQWHRPWPLTRLVDRPTTIIRLSKDIQLRLKDSTHRCPLKNPSTRSKFRNSNSKTPSWNRNWWSPTDDTVSWANPWNWSSNQKWDNLKVLATKVIRMRFKDSNRRWRTWKDPIQLKFNLTLLKYKTLPILRAKSQACKWRSESTSKLLTLRIKSSDLNKLKSTIAQRLKFHNATLKIN